MFGTLILLYAINILIFKMSIILYFPPSMLVACALLPACGFLLGFGCSYAVCEVPRARRTIMLETGLKNAQICLAILKVSFPIARIGVLQMMPLYFLLFQVDDWITHYLLMHFSRLSSQPFLPAFSPKSCQLRMMMSRKRC